MAEMLVFTKKIERHPDPKVAAMQYAPGHVITIQEDNYPWHPEVFESNYHAKVVKVSGVSREKLEHLCAIMPDNMEVAVDEEPVLRQLRIWRMKSIPDSISLEEINQHLERVPHIIDRTVL